MNEQDERTLTQGVRLIDVFLLGPTMMYVGIQKKDWIHQFLFLSGLATIVFNGVRYIKGRRINNVY